MQLCADAAVIAVDDLCQLLIIGEPFFIKQRFLKLALANRHISDNDHRAAAGGNFANFLKIRIIGKSERRRRKDNTVFQFQPAVIDGAIDCFVHDEEPFPLLFPVKPATVFFLWE